MIESRKRGAVLGLVVALAFFMIILGIGFFYIARLIGGHRELEHATDAGNLQVAKKSLRSPLLNVFPSGGFNGPYDLSDPTTLSEVQRNFSQLADPATGQVDLLVYDRLVAQCFLVALNAAADGFDNGTAPSPYGIQRAQRLIGFMNDPSNGVGVSLSKKLKQDPILDTNFTNLANQDSLRMLKKTGTSVSIANEKDISFMVRGKASNVFLDQDVLPGFFNQNNVASNFFVKNGVSYLAGYQYLGVAGVVGAGPNGLMGVPLRPGELPHLVDGTDFTALQQASPQPGSDPTVKTVVPPNAFRSDGLGQDMRTNLFTQAASCAIAGSINLAPSPVAGPNPFPGNVPGSGPYPIAIPNGFIAVANGGGTEPILPSPPGPIGFSGGPQCKNVGVSQDQTLDTFATLLMSGLIWVAPSNTPSGTEWAVATDANCISALIQNQQDHLATYGTRLHGDELAAAAACLDNPDKLAVADGINVNSSQHRCNNINSYPDAEMGGQEPDSDCIAARPTVTAIFGGTSGSNTQTYCLSALEFDEATVISDRANSGSTFLQPFNSCTGLDAFALNPNQFSNDSIQKTPPNINQLIGPSGTFVAYGSSGIPGSQATASFANKVYSDFKTRIAQIKPNLSQGEVNGILATPVPLGSIMYVWLDGSDQSNPILRFTTAASLPPRINVTSVNLDGTPVISTTDFTQNGTTQKLALISDNGGGGNGYLDRNGDGGYPHPFDCAPFGAGTVTSSATWTPNSGFDGLLGVLRFQNCVSTGGGINMDCPC